MANKRDLKKRINYICCDLASNCISIAAFNEGVDEDKMSHAVAKLAKLQTEVLSNATFSFDKVPSDFENRALYNRACESYYRKAYNSLVAKFENKLQEIVKEMNAAIPAELKEANRKAAAKA